MVNQKVVVVLLVIAIILSAVNVIIGLGFDVGDYRTAGAGGTQQTSDFSGGEVTLVVGNNGGNQG